MISEALQKARDFEAQYQHFVDGERPRFHVTGGIGWINDPNGFSVYKGEYHLFFQYHPYSTHWGPMHWGHVKTKDFIRWERLPIALAPDTEMDRDGCFSGSAVELPDGRHLLMYTGVCKVRRSDGVVEEIQNQCIAIGDGVNYEKYEKNPVLDVSDLPEGGSELDFRDPKLWYESGSYWAVISNRSEDGSGDILLCQSQDALHWRYVKKLASCRNEYGTMWECPDFFPLDGKQVLMTCPMEMAPMGLEFHSGFGTLCLIGDYDRETLEFHRERVQAIDYGLDFYATQTVKTPDGRVVMVAWMQNWATSTSQQRGKQLFGSLTLPRELSIREGRLIQNPVRELEAYRGRRTAYENVLVESETNLAGISGRVLDLTVTVRPADEGGYRAFRLNLAKDGEHVAVIRYKPGRNTVRIDRTRSGGRFDIVHVRDFLVRPRDEAIKLRVVLDRSSVELFVNDGEQAATFRLYSPERAQAISFEAEGGAVLMDVEKFELDV